MTPSLWLSIPKTGLPINSLRNPFEGAKKSLQTSKFLNFQDPYLSLQTSLNNKIG